MKKRIYRKDYNGVALYSLMMSNKKEDGTYDNVFLPVRFRHGVEVENKADIEILDWFPTFYRDKNNNPVIQAFIMDFKQEAVIQKQEVKNDPFEDFGREVEIKDEDLPF